MYGARSAAAGAAADTTLRQQCLGKPTGAAHTALLRSIDNGKGPLGCLGPDSVAVKAKSQQQLQELCIIGLDSESGEDD